MVMEWLFVKKNVLKETLLKRQFTKKNEVEIIIFNSFIPYLSDKNIA